MNIGLSMLDPCLGLLTPFTDPSLEFWSPVIFWYVAIAAILCGVFTLVVIVGGIFDLRFLFKALNEEVTDETDDGRVSTEGPDSSGGEGA